MGNLACLWLERYPGKEPFFLQIGLPGPHPPYDPTPDYLAKYADRPLPEPIRGNFDAQPSALRALRQQHLSEDHDAIVHLADPSQEQMRRQRAHYYANVSMIDAQVGKILDALEARGVLENTIIIFSSDHGDCLNDHGHSQKWTMYEQSVRVPAIVCGPGIRSSLQVDDLVSLMDLGPTILELAGVEVPSWMEAKSLRPYLKGETVPVRDCVFSEHANDKILEKTQFMTMVRKGDWKLVHFVDSDEGQLFDLWVDPQEVNNRWDDPECADVKQSRLLEILNWRIQSNRITQGFWRYLASPVLGAILGAAKALCCLRYRDSEPDRMKNGLAQLHCPLLCRIRK